MISFRSRKKRIIQISTSMLAVVDCTLRNISQFSLMLDSKPIHRKLLIRVFLILIYQMNHTNLKSHVKNSANTSILFFICQKFMDRVFLNSVDFYLMGKELQILIKIFFMMVEKVLVTGPFGQIGSELVPELQEIHGKQNVVALGHSKIPPHYDGLLEKGSINDKEGLAVIIKKHQITTVYHLAALLSAVGQNKPDLAWEVNLEGLKVIFDLAVEFKLKVFWASSMAVFGPTTPKKNTPQRTIIEPTTIYGVTKYSGELLGQYYNKKFGTDIRSLRYPGLISWAQECGGGTTDYAVAIFYDAIKTGKYQCFVKQDTVLPMMYMSDGIKATLQIMQAPSQSITVRTSYNLAAISFSVKQLADQLRKYIPNLEVTYKPDSRQEIADSWVDSIDDSQARQDWGWKPQVGLEELVKIMFENLTKKLKS